MHTAIIMFFAPSNIPAANISLISPPPKHPFVIIAIINIGILTRKAPIIWLEIVVLWSKTRETIDRNIIIIIRTSGITMIRKSITEIANKTTRIRKTSKLSMGLHLLIFVYKIILTVYIFLSIQVIFISQINII